MVSSCAEKNEIHTTGLQNGRLRYHLPEGGVRINKHMPACCFFLHARRKNRLLPLLHHSYRLPCTRTYRGYQRFHLRLPDLKNYNLRNIHRQPDPTLHVFWSYPSILSITEEAL